MTNIMVKLFREQDNRGKLGPVAYHIITRTGKRMFGPLKHEFYNIPDPEYE